MPATKYPAVAAKQLLEPEFGAYEPGLQGVQAVAEPPYDQVPGAHSSHL
jgi:hypothetical protein